MSLADAILSHTRRPTARVYLDGRRWTGVLTASVSQEYGQGVGSATLTGRDPPTTPRPGMSIRVDWGYNGVTVRGFTGYVVTTDRSSYPKRWTLQCSDVLWLAERESQPIAVSPLNDVTARAAIEYILSTYAGITRTAIPDINRPSDSGTDWTLGHLTPVSWESDTTALAACQEIAATAGYWLYADAGGTVRARLMERRPSSSPFRTLAKGDAAGATLLVSGAPNRRQDASQVKNRITVRGAATGVEGAQLYDTFQATHALLPGVTNTFEYESFLLEYEADVTAVASRIAGVWNRVPNVVTARIKADPRLAVGTTVAIRDDNIGYSAAQSFFIYRLQTSIDLTSGRFEQQITLDGGVGDAGFTTIPPPVAVASASILTQTVDGDGVAIVTVDGSASYSQSEGEIVSYAWSTASTVYGSSATSATGATAVFVFPTASSPVTITLTVTDTSSKTGTIDLVIDLATGDGVSAPETENVIAAGGSAAEGTTDGGAVWHAEVETVTVVAEGAGVRDDAPLTDATAYGTLFAVGAEVHRTLDVLGTASTTLHTFGGSITALHVNAKNGARAWAAVGTALYRSLDGGTTWAAWGTLPATVRQIIEDPAVDNSVFVLAGANAYNTYRADGTSPGSSWATLYAGPSGATARWMVRSDDGAITWICYEGTFTGEPIQRVESGSSVSWTGASAPAEVTAIALDQTDPTAPRLVAVDADRQTWVGPAPTGAMVAGPVLPTGASAKHATASRKAAEVYIADFDSVTSGTGALRKLLLQGTGLLLPWHPGDSGRQFHMVQLAAPGRTVRAYLLRVTWDVSPGGVYLYDPDANTWTLKNSGLPTGWKWSSVAVNPFNPDDWILVGTNTSPGIYGVNDGGTLKNATSGQSPYWRTLDAGATWNPITVSVTHDFNGLNVKFDEQTGGRWFSAGNIPGTGAPSAFLRGTTSATSFEVATILAYHAASGQGGDLIFAATDNKLRYIADGATTATLPSGTGWGAPGDAETGIDRHPADRRLLAVTSGGALSRTTDYRSAQPASTGLTTCTSVALAAARAFVGTSDGLKEVLDPWGSPSLGGALVGGGYPVLIRSARQGRAQTIAIGGTINASGSTNMVISDGVSAREVTGPAVTPSDLGAAFDVFVRAT